MVVSPTRGPHGHKVAMWSEGSRQLPVTTCRCLCWVCAAVGLCFLGPAGAPVWSWLRGACGVVVVWCWGVPGSQYDGVCNHTQVGSDQACDAVLTHLGTCRHSWCGVLGAVVQVVWRVGVLALKCCLLLHSTRAGRLVHPAGCHVSSQLVGSDSSDTIYM